MKIAMRQVALRVIDLLQIGGVAYRFDPLLQGDDVLRLVHDGEIERRPWS
jgi:hypothetical protein